LQLARTRRKLLTVDYGGNDGHVSFIPNCLHLYVLVTLTVIFSTQY
jgi:hypothetical protein